MPRCLLAQRLNAGRPSSSACCPAVGHFTSFRLNLPPVLAVLLLLGSTSRRLLALTTGSCIVHSCSTLVTLDIDSIGHIVEGMILLQTIFYALTSSVHFGFSQSCAQDLLVGLHTWI